jgi:hypothetical protein
VTARYITHDGITDTLAGWSARLGLYPDAVGRRLRDGWDEEAAVSGQRPRGARSITVGGEALTVHEWSAKSGIAADCILARLRSGWPPEVAVSQPTREERGHATVVEDAELLAGAGETFGQAAKRIGYTKPGSLARALYRAGRGDLVRKLRRNGSAV